MRIYCLLPFYPKTSQSKKNSAKYSHRNPVYTNMTYSSPGMRMLTKLDSKISPNWWKVKFCETFRKFNLFLYFSFPSYACVSCLKKIETIANVPQRVIYKCAAIDLLIGAFSVIFLMELEKPYTNITIMTLNDVHYIL